MLLSRRIQDSKARAIIAELQSYNCNVIGQRYSSADGADGNDLCKFFERYMIDEIPPIVWLSPAVFREEFDNRLVQPDEDAGLNVYSRWVLFRAATTDNLDGSAFMGKLVANRLREGRPVTLTPLTATALANEWSHNPPEYCARVLRRALWLLVHYVLRSKRPMMIALHRREGGAKLRHLRVESVAAYFVRPEHSWR